MLGEATGKERCAPPRTRVVHERRRVWRRQTSAIRKNRRSISAAIAMAGRRGPVPGRDSSLASDQDFSAAICIWRRVSLSGGSRRRSGQARGCRSACQIVEEAGHAGCRGCSPREFRGLPKVIDALGRRSGWLAGRVTLGRWQSTMRSAFEPGEGHCGDETAAKLDCPLSRA